MRYISKNNFRIYTAGKMKGGNLDDQMKWRKDVESYLELYDDLGVEVFNPPDFYNYECENHYTEHEIKEFELTKLAESDVLLVDLAGLGESTGATFEIAFADTINRNTDRHIYIVGFGDKSGIHPWLKDCFLRIEPCLEDAVDYIHDFLMR